MRRVLEVALLAALASGCSGAEPERHAVDLEGFALTPGDTFPISAIQTDPARVLEAVRADAPVDSFRIVTVLYETEAPPPLTPGQRSAWVQIEPVAAGAVVTYVEDGKRCHTYVVLGMTETGTFLWPPEWLGTQCSTSTS